MSPALRQALVVGAFATMFSVTATLVVSSLTHPTVVLATPTQSVGTNPGTTYTPGIVTTGDATISTRPDIAFLGAGVQAQDSTASAAQRDLAALANKLIARAKGLGIPDSDINTSGYAIGPRYTSDGSVNGYEASEQLEMKWHNVDNVGTALDALVQQGGATRVSVSFGLADPKAAQADARALAIADARNRGAAMAKAAGVQLGQVLSVTDSTTGGRTDPLSFAAAPAADTQVPVGQLDVMVTVEVDFAIA
jgi:uncharacterized protein YggE